MKQSGSSRRASTGVFAGEYDVNLPGQRYPVRCQGSDRFLSTAKENSPSMPQAPQRIVSPVAASRKGPKEEIEECGDYKHENLSQGNSLFG
jgi:hypothetical protein